MKLVVALYDYFPFHNQQSTVVAAKTQHHTAHNTMSASHLYDINRGYACPFNFIEYGLSYYQIEGCMLWFCDGHNSEFVIILSFYKAWLFF